MKAKAFRLIVIVTLSVSLLGIAIYSMVWNGVIILNGLSAIKYPVRGIDVSSYQGEIDWQTLSCENISFAFIKATEGRRNY